MSKSAVQQGEVPLVNVKVTRTNQDASTRLDATAEVELPIGWAAL